MPRGIAITNTDYTIDDLRARNSKCKEPTVGRRLRAIIGVMEDRKSRAEIALRARVGRQTLRDWVIRYNAEGPDGLKDRQRCGRPSKLDEGQRAEVGRWLDEGPEPGSPSWTIGMLREKIREVFAVVLCLEAVRGLIHRLGFRKISPRPVHPKADLQAQEHFRNNFSFLAISALPEGMDPASVDIYFQDEARIGQKGMLTRVWARMGSRPRVFRDHRFGYCYLFSAICPASGTAVGHVADRANTWEMSRHLREIGGTTEPGRHALVILDGAGWHVSKHLEVPDNVTLLRLPPYSPELNSSENVFQFLKARYFANQVFATVEAVKERVEKVWRAFEANPDRITSIGSRSWAQINCRGAVES